MGKHGVLGDTILLDEEGELAKKDAVVVCKALRIFYAILRKAWSMPQKLMGDIRRPQAQVA